MQLSGLCCSQISTQTERIAIFNNILFDMLWFQGGITYLGQGTEREPKKSYGGGGHKYYGTIRFLAKYTYSMHSEKKEQFKLFAEGPFITRGVVRKSAKKVLFLVKFCDLFSLSFKDC